MKLAPNPGGMHMTHPVKNNTKQTCRKEDSHNKIYMVQVFVHVQSFRKIIFEGKDTNINDVNTNRKNYTTQAAQSTTKNNIISLFSSLSRNIHFINTQSP